MSTVGHASAIHPLDPLSDDEIGDAANILRASSAFPRASRFVSIECQEPTKTELAEYAAGKVLERRAFIVIRDVEQA